MEKPDLRELALSLITALGINILFLGVAALVYWLLSVPQMIGRLALGFAVLWGSLLVVVALSQVIQTVFRLNLYDHYLRYVLMNLLFSALPLLGFCAFAALQVHQVVAGFSIGGGITLFVIGFLACYTAHAIVTTFFHGQLYALINAGLGLCGYLVCAFWPGAARALFGLSG